MSTIIPFGNRILVRLDGQESVHESGIVIPDIAQEKSMTGVVEAVGTGTSHPSRDTLLSIEDQGVRTGDRVLLTSAYAGAESGEPGVILVDLTEVLAVLS